MRAALLLFLMITGLFSGFSQVSPDELQRLKTDKLADYGISAQSSSMPGLPEQDCNSAIAVCQSTYVQPTAYSGYGNLQEVPTSSCLGSREKNSVWYIFTVQTSGTLTFTIDPNDNSDDYDFGLYDLTGRNCNDIVTGAAPEVRCNYCVDPGNTGISASGQNASEDCCSNSPGCQFSSILNVTVGQTYVLVVSNYSSSQSGYTLTFGGTAEIFDQTPPAAASVVTPCGVNFMNVQMTEAVLCSSISGNGSEFSLTGPGGPFTVTAAQGDNCGSATSQLTLTISPQVIIGSEYTLTINTGTDGNTLIDNCGNALSPGTSLTFTATPSDAEIFGPTQICAGSSTDLSTVQGTSYQWSTGATTQSISVSPTVETTYTVTVTSGTCTQSAEHTVSVKPSPIADFSYDPTTVCTGQSIHFTNESTLLQGCFLTGTPCTTNADCSPFPCVDNFTIPVWNFGDGSTTFAQNPNHTWNTPGTYNVSLFLTDIFGGCTNEMVVTINVIADAGELVVPDDQEICIGESVTITAEGGTDYSWTSVPAGFTSSEASITVSPTSTTTYNVTSPGCSSALTGSVTVTVNPLPDIRVSPEDDLICAGSSTTLTAIGGGTYVWSPATGLNTATGPEVIASPVSTTVYTVTGTDDNGCENTATATVEVDESVNPTISANAPTSYCEGDEINVTLDAGAGYEAYDWSTGETTQQITVTDGGEYSVTVLNAAECTGISSITISVIPGVEAIAGKDVTICEGESTQLSASGGQSYSWSPSTGLSNSGVANPAASPTTTTEYVVTVSQGSCSDQDTVTVNVKPAPVITVSPDVTIAPGESAQLNATGGLSYFWDPSTGLDDETISNPVSSPLETITYTVTVTGENECSSSETVTVTVEDIPECRLATLFIPTAFSPNNDGLNDVFRIQLDGEYDRLELTVRDRWGKEVFATDDINTVWDGTRDGQELSGDSYAYFIRIYCGQEIVTRQGSIALVR